jgi:hypothetical protein
MADQDHHRSDEPQDVEIIVAPEIHIHKSRRVVVAATLIGSVSEFLV